MSELQISVDDVCFLEATIEVAKTNPQVAKEILGFDADLMRRLMSLDATNFTTMDTCLPLIKQKICDCSISSRILVV